MSADRFSAAHEATRAWSPFNGQPYLRLNREHGVIGLAQGFRIGIDRSGTVERRELSTLESARFLVDEIGIRESVARFFVDA